MVKWPGITIKPSRFTKKRTYKENIYKRTNQRALAPLRDGENAFTFQKWSFCELKIKIQTPLCDGAAALRPERSLRVDVHCLAFPVGRPPHGDHNSRHGDGNGRFGIEFGADVEFALFI